MNSSDTKPDRPKWWRRLLSPKLLLITAAVIVVIGAIGLLVAIILITPYQKKADEFDLAEIRKVETASVVYDRNGEVLGSLFTENRRPISVDEIPQSIIFAVMATEDSNFFDHSGVDFKGVLRAGITNIKRGKIAQGASTITQQLARQTFEMRELSYKRKLVEALLAFRIEEEYSKAEIIQHYLNLIYFGNGFYGIESAAIGYFGRSADKLTLAESATLAALIKRPNAYNPFKSIELTTAARNRTLKRMYEEKYINRSTYEEALAEPVTCLPPELRGGKGLHVMNQIRRRLAEMSSGLASHQGCQIYTTIDAKLERILGQKVRQNLAATEQAPGAEDRKGKQTLEAAVTMIDNRTGELLASIGGRSFSRSEFDRAFNAKRMMGTAFTPFVYAAAIERGLDPYAQVNDAPIDNREVMIGAVEGILGEWGAEDRDNRYQGPISAWRAIVASKNAATVRLAAGITKIQASDFLFRAGFKNDIRIAPSTILGQTEASPAELTLAYTAFPNGGERPNKIKLIRKVVAEDGTVIYDAADSNDMVQVMTPLTAGYVHSALVGALEQGTGQTSIRELGLKHMPAGGKTGTAYNFTDAWFMGYSSEVTCGVWVGYDRPENIGQNAYGSVLALPIWVDAMNAAASTYTPKEIPPPPGTERVFLCDYTGMASTQYCGHVRQMPGVGEPGFVSCSHRAYLPIEIAQRLKPCSKHLPSGSSQEAIQVLPPSLSAPTTQSDVTFVKGSPILPQGAPLVGKDPFGTVNEPNRSAVQAVPVKTIQSPWRFSSKKKGG